MNSPANTASARLRRVFLVLAKQTEEVAVELHDPEGIDLAVTLVRRAVELVSDLEDPDLEEAVA